jgi:hypothetical protein
VGRARPPGPRGRIHPAAGCGAGGRTHRGALESERRTRRQRRCSWRRCRRSTVAGRRRRRGGRPASLRRERGSAGWHSAPRARAVVGAHGRPRGRAGLRGADRRIPRQRVPRRCHGHGVGGCTTGPARHENHPSARPEQFLGDLVPGLRAPDDQHRARRELGGTAVLDSVQLHDVHRKLPGQRRGARHVLPAGRDDDGARAKLPIAGLQDEAGRPRRQRDDRRVLPHRGAGSQPAEPLYDLGSGQVGVRKLVAQHRVHPAGVVQPQ